MSVRPEGLWLRWVFANAIGELLGLGAAFALGVGLFSRVAEGTGAWSAIAGGGLMTASGMLEGAVVGAAQGWAMRPALPSLPGRAWVHATGVGARVAWFLGAIPTVLSALGAPGQADAPPQPGAGCIFLLPGGMGLVAGLVLSFPQWYVLRQDVERAALWLPANAMAWAVGMPIVFRAVDLAQQTGTLWGAVGLFAVALLLTGGIVGAIHGLALVCLLWTGRSKSQTYPI